ncbi:MAG: hypothetical protein ACK4WH_09080 [Phycisphaerales bacterium]
MTDAAANMANIPNDRRDLLTFAVAHQGVWASAPAAIGITPAQAAAVSARAAEVAALNERMARLRAEVSTVARELADGYVSLRAAVNTAVRGINTFARAAADPAAVYSAARINPPSPPPPRSGIGAVIPPRAPHTLRAALLPGSGAITLTWKARQPAGVAGVVYTVARRLAGEAVYAPIGTTGAKMFTDETIPAGTAAVSYRVTAQRGSLATAPAPEGTIHVLLASPTVGGPGTEPVAPTVPTAA